VHTLSVVFGTEGQCRQRLEIAGTMGSACGMKEITRFCSPGALGRTLGYYEPSATMNAI
jgi:hypothetical protein